MTDKYVYIITALLPLSAIMLVSQKDPYHALVIRAIMGAIAALVYAILGAADVALTEAMVGTMLAVTLYVIAVRSSLVMRLGIVPQNNLESTDKLAEILEDFKKVIRKYYLRLELVEYPSDIDLKTALCNREIHAAIKPEISQSNSETTHQTAIRVKRLFEIMQAELIDSRTSFAYIALENGEKKH